MSVWPEDLAHLDVLTARLGLTRSAAIRHVIRLAATGETPVSSSRSDHHGSGEELLLHNLVATEQVIRLLERFLPGGPAAAAEVLPLAVGAAQERIAGSGRVPG